jgi:hypothetical protein
MHIWIQGEKEEENASGGEPLLEWWRKELHGMVPL